MRQEYLYSRRGCWRAVPSGLFISAEEEPPSLDKDPRQPRSGGPTMDITIEGVCYTSQLAQDYFALPSESESQPRSREVLFSQAPSMDT